jgi:hypothetical protein
MTTINKKNQHTSGPLTGMKLSFDSEATALARRVFEHPGGPYNRIPETRNERYNVRAILKSKRTNELKTIETLWRFNSQT